MKIKVIIHCSCAWQRGHNAKNNIMIGKWNVETD